VLKQQKTVVSMECLHNMDEGGANNPPTQELGETDPFSFEYPSSTSTVFENITSPAEILNALLETK
jgi:hypothetical protein